MPLILLVMRKPGNIRVLTHALEDCGHECKGVESPEGLESVLREESKPHVALVDVAGFGESVWLMCQKLHSQRVPFVVLSAKHELGLSSKTLSYGAKSILEKPVVKDSLLKLISNIATSGA